MKHITGIAPFKTNNKYIKTYLILKKRKSVYSKRTQDRTFVLENIDIMITCPIIQPSDHCKSSIHLTQPCLYIATLTGALHNIFPPFVRFRLQIIRQMITSRSLLSFAALCLEQVNLHSVANFYHANLPSCMCGV